MKATSSGSAIVTLPADNQILVTREFDAPADLVFKALTTPELVKQWWGANRGAVTLCEIDLRVGGRWRYVMDAANGMEVGFHGEYREIVPNERLVHTEAFEGAPDPDANASVVTTELAEHDGRTTMTVLMEFPSREIRDAVIATGMESGMQESYDALEEVAASLR